MKTSTIDLVKLKKLAQSATQGPWDYNGNCKYGVWSLEECCYVFMTGSHDDAYFTAAANPVAILAIIQKLEAAERERDELRADIKRRDAAAGEAVGKFVKCGDTWYETDATDGIPLYTAAQPVVVPPEISEAIARLEKGYFRRWVRAYKNPEEPEGYVGGSVLVSDLVKLFEFAKSAQQQKVVELPEPVKWPEVPYRYFSEDQVFSMLNAAGVKWEVKK